MCRGWKKIPFTLGVALLLALAPLHSHSFAGKRFNLIYHPIMTTLVLTLCNPLGLVLAQGSFVDPANDSDNLETSLCNISGDSNETLTCSGSRGSFYPTGGNSSNCPQEQAQTDVRVTSYNVCANGRCGDGSNEQGLQPIIKLFRPDGPLENTDLILLQEATRFCDSDRQEDGAREFAKILNRSYIYFPSFRFLGGGRECTTGNAIISRRPIKNPGFFYFKQQCCQFSERLGGRGIVYGSIDLPKGNKLHVYNVHLESGDSGLKGYTLGAHTRLNQVRETILFIKSRHRHGDISVIAGDFNDPFLAGTAFRGSGYQDAFKSFIFWRRVTCPDSPLAKINLAIFDYIFKLGSSGIFYNPWVCWLPECLGISDHLPLTVRVAAEDLPS
jgi:endonuclease/exonuclease/phosphatase family metal-dependent hydrolase